MVEPDGYRRYLHPGEGTIDFARFFSGLARHGFNGSISLEASSVQRDRTVNIERVQASLAFLRELLEQSSNQGHH